VLLFLLKCRFAKVGNTGAGAGSIQTSRHRQQDNAADQSEMMSHSLDSSNNSWRLSLLRNVMGDSLCETGK